MTEAAGESPRSALRKLARTVEWPRAVPEDEFLDLVDEQLSPRPHAKVVVAGGPSVPSLAELLRLAYPELRIVEVDSAADPSAVHVALCVSNPYNSIVDLSEGPAAEQADLFLRTFMHLGRGGTYVVRRVAAGEARQPEESSGSSAPRPGHLSNLGNLLEQAPLTVFRAEDPHDQQDLHWLGQSIGEITTQGDALVVSNARRVRPKLRDDQINPILQARPDIGRVIESWPRSTLVSRCDYQESPRVVDPQDAEFRNAYQLTEFDVPPLHLRLYAQPTCGRGQIVESGGLLLPDTYRLHRHRRLQNVFVNDNSPLFGDVRTALGDPIPLAGAYFHFDSEWPGHFGHTTTEQISRLWAFERAKEREPDLKLLTTLPKSRPEQRLQDWEVALLEPFGIGTKDIVVFDQAVRPERLYAATPMFSAPDYVHPQIVETWDRIGRSLGADAEKRERPSRIFCSRPPGLKRDCVNASAVERLFMSRGFVIVYPESHTLAEQVAMFQAADVIGGFAGSALFTMAFRETPATVVMIAPESYTARNEYLFASVRGHALRVAWSKPDIPHPDGRWSADAFGSSFRFDTEAEGGYVNEVLDALDALDALDT